MAKRKFEKRSLGLALTAYLISKGWTTLTYSEGYGSNKTITLPQIAVTFAPSAPRELQIGRVGITDRLFARRIQIDAYMESEDRADAIIDDIMDFIDFSPVQIVDMGANILGSLICQDSETIYAETLPPATDTPMLMKWRGVVRAEMEAHYPNG